MPIHMQHIRNGDMLLSELSCIAVVADLQDPAADVGLVCGQKMFFGVITIDGLPGLPAEITPNRMDAAKRVSPLPIQADSAVLVEEPHACLLVEDLSQEPPNNRFSRPCQSRNQLTH